MKAYQMKITVKESKPPVWRRLIVPAGLSFSQLSIILNEAMGWTGYHLDCFTFKKLGVEFEEEPEDDFWGDVDQYNAAEYIIDHFVEEQKTFLYTYDFGDEWIHTVVIEKVLDDYDKNYPEVIKFKGDALPEDCGGIWGHYHLMEVLQNPEDPEYGELKEWYGDAADYAFDIDTVNENLQAMKLTKRKSKPQTRNEIYQKLEKGKAFTTISGKYDIEEMDEDDFWDFDPSDEPAGIGKLLIVVDMQNDFIDGALGTKEAQKILPDVVEKIKTFEGPVLFTQDTHEENYLETQEGKKLPVEHCIRETEGWKLYPEIAALVGDEENIIEKPTFGSAEIAAMLGKMSEKFEIESITLIGLCTDICVISNAMTLKAFLPEVPIIVDSKCCAGVTPESHENALRAMSACQIEIV